MKPVVINIKVDERDKKKAQDLAHELGLSLSGVLKMYLKEFLRTKHISVGMQAEEPSEYLKNALRQSEKDIAQGAVSPSFKTAKDAIAWLNDSDAKYENGDSV